MAPQPKIETLGEVFYFYIRIIGTINVLVKFIFGSGWYGTTCFINVEDNSCRH